MENHFDSIEHKLLTTGHSFLLCDIDFACIEKCKQVSKTYVPEDVIISAKLYNPFEVVQMESENLHNIQEAVDKVLNLKRVDITRLVAMRVESKNPGGLKVKKKTFSALKITYVLIISHSHMLEKLHYLFSYLSLGQKDTQQLTIVNSKQFSTIMHSLEARK